MNQKTNVEGLWDQAPLGSGVPPPLPPRQQRPVKRRRKKKAGWRAVAGYAALALLCLCLGIVAFLLVVPPTDGLRDRLIAQITERTGRTVAIAGGTSVSIFPRPMLALADVSLDVPAGMPGGPTLSIPVLEVELDAWSLVTGRIVAERVTVRRSVVELLVDAGGRRSWEIRRTGGERRASIDAAPAAAQEGAPKVSPRPATRQPRVGFTRLVVRDATVRYRDARNDALYEVTGMSLSATADEAAGTIAFEGSADWNNERVTLAGKTAPLLRPVAGEAAPLEIKVSGKHFEASYDGSVVLTGGFALDGRFALKSPSSSAALAWLGRADAADVGPLAVSAKVAVAGPRTTLSDIDAAIAGFTVQGSFGVETGGERPLVSAKLAVSEPALDAPAARAAPERGVEEPPSPAKPGRRSRDGRRDSPSETAKTWREDPIDLASLRKADANIALSIGRVTYKGVKLGPGTVDLDLKDGFARLTLNTLELYGGRAQGLLTLDGAGDAPVLGANLKLSGFAMLALAGDALGFGWLDGRGEVALELAGQGRSEREIVDGLNGRMRLRVADGAMIGADVGKIVGNLQQGRFTGLSPSPGDRTPFSELAASFDIVNGTAVSRDLRLASAHLNLDGHGTFTLGERQMDCELRAKISGGKRGDGAHIGVGSLELPVTIRGPWERPTYGVKGQEQLMDAVRDVGKRLKSPDVQDTIKGLLGSDKEERAKSRAKARELLENFLKKE